MTTQSPSFALHRSHRRWIFIFVMSAGLTAIHGAERTYAQDPIDSAWESTQKTLDRVSRFVTGREQANASKAKDLYQEGDRIFRAASANSSQVARDGDTEGREKAEFAKAAKLFRRASEAEPGSALSQDALFMQAESLFFADQLTEATDIYQKLQKDYPRNRHSDRVASRLFSITQYWIDTEKAGGGGIMPINLFDPTRPRLDVDGHAIRVLDSIRYDDPTGRLADDATMAAAAEYIRQGKFEMADEFLTDLRETFPDSEHFFLAHMLGIRCKLEVYAGPQYSGLMLEEAEKLVQQTRERFPNKLQDQQTADMLARASAEVAFRHAEHLSVRAQYREKKREFRAATEYYQRILNEYPNTPQAEKARERLQETTSLPAVPERRLTWLKAVFPDSKSSSPLEFSFESPTGEKRETVLR
ncbi:tetratricopeptide repeat protein [Neorhodopirellula pilleata]|nr:tetratricopeptide repeat protein [Neorhodopirellula pilleata]